MSKLRIIKPIVQENFDNDWGLFVDIEKMDETEMFTNKKNDKTKNERKRSSCIIDIDFVYDYEYLHENDLLTYDPTVNEKHKHISESLFSCGCTTVITGLITYFVLTVI